MTHSWASLNVVLLLTYLPSLKQEAAVDRTKPHYGVATLEIAQFSATIVQKQAQALEQFGGWGLLKFNIINVYNVLDTICS